MLVGYSCGHHGTHTPVGRSYKADEYYSIQGPVLGKPIDRVSTLAVWIATSGVIKASQQEERFILSSRWISLCLASEVSGAFNSSALSSSYREKTKAKAHVV